jgi:TolB-like protein/Tfp pilus assembly protein PilF
MNKETGGNDRTVKGTRRWALSPRAVLTLAGALVVIIGLVIGLDMGGLREKLLWRISPPRMESLVVLPFENLSRDPEHENFAYRTTILIIGDLQQIGAVRVIAPPSVARYRKAAKPLPEIARELNVAGIVQGGVLRSGDRVRISVNLIHAPSNRHLWGQSYERDLRDIQNLHAEVARAIARSTRVNLSPQEEAHLTAPRKTVNPQAYDAWLRGASAMSGTDPAKSDAYLKQAIQLDPAFARPYEYLAMSSYMRNMFPTLAPRDTYPATKAAAQKAISLESNSANLRRIVALSALEYDWDFAEAEKELRRALEIAPSGVNARHGYSHFLLSMGRMEEAKAEGRRIIELDPMDPTIIACVSWHDIAMGDYEEAEKHAAQALSLGAPDQLARLTLGWSYALRGRQDEAIPEFQKAVVGWKGAFFPTAVLGHAYAVAGNKDAAREILNKLLARSRTEYVSPYEIAMIYAGLGDRDHAFEWLEKAFEERATLLVYFRMDPRIWSLPSDARFQDLLRRMNFPQDRRN